VCLVDIVRILVDILIERLMLVHFWLMFLHNG
jgi:hypothetical protein